MKNPFLPGDTQCYSTQVTDDKLATFEDGQVHPFYSTFALGRDAEWACRLFVLAMKEEGEEGIGTYLSIEHRSPALRGENITIIAKLESVIKNEVVCTYEVRTGERIIAVGKQIQKILLTTKIDQLIASLPSV